ncbi:hypothetical protein BLNAU_19251 [Blattamonas nauphoetae]|uniref:Uncharacterized protein n=1 Tax=Blattamonas nauphoetae TaxID=2049346 RepID=A0ABQ9X226_9EUKA|nr:hypothetical protein BLNAU_19251 [Blattamonas nauphoetae]
MNVKHSQINNAQAKFRSGTRNLTLQLLHKEPIVVPNPKPQRSVGLPVPDVTNAPLQPLIQAIRQLPKLPMQATEVPNPAVSEQENIKDNLEIQVRDLSRLKKRHIGVEQSHSQTVLTMKRRGLSNRPVLPLVMPMLIMTLSLLEDNKVKAQEAKSLEQIQPSKQVTPTDSAHQTRPLTREHKEIEVHRLSIAISRAISHSTAKKKVTSRRQIQHTEGNLINHN